MGCVFEARIRPHPSGVLQRVRAYDDAFGVEEVVYRAAFPQELGVGGDRRPVPLSLKRLAQDRLDRLAGADRRSTLVNDEGPVVRCR
jgi:hypothetical protein